MNITAAELTDEHMGSQISLRSSVSGEVYAGEFVSAIAGVLFNDTRLRVELIIDNSYCSAFVYPETPVTIL